MNSLEIAACRDILGVFRELLADASFSDLNDSGLKFALYGLAKSVSEISSKSLLKEFLYFFY